MELRGFPSNKLCVSVSLWHAQRNVSLIEGKRSGERASMNRFTLLPLCLVFFVEETTSPAHKSPKLISTFPSQSGGGRFLVFAFARLWLACYRPNEYAML